MPKFQSDFAYIGRSEGEKTLPYLSVVDVGSGSIFAIATPLKAASAYTIAAVVELIDSLGYDRIVTKTEQESIGGNL